MKEKLFDIKCTTCEAIFSVNDPELIGQIIECQKCGGMIYITPPYGYNTQKEPDNSSTSEKETSESLETASDLSSKPSLAPPVVETVLASSVPPVVDTVLASSVPPVAETVLASSVPPVAETVLASSVPPVVDTVLASSVPPVVDTVLASSVPPVAETVLASFVPPVVDTVLASSVPPVVETVLASSVPPVAETVLASSVPPVVDTVLASSAPPVAETVLATSVPPVVDTGSASSVQPTAETDSNSIKKYDDKKIRLYLILAGVIFILLTIMLVLLFMLKSQKSGGIDGDTLIADKDVSVTDSVPPANGVAEQAIPKTGNSDRVTEAEGKIGTSETAGTEQQPNQTPSDSTEQKTVKKDTESSSDSSDQDGKQMTESVGDMPKPELEASKLPDAVPTANASPSSAPENAVVSDKNLMKETLTVPTSDKTEKTDSAEVKPEESEDEFVSTTMTTNTSFQKYLPSLKKEIPKLDINERLKGKIESLSYTSGRLSDLLRVFSGLSGVPITIDLGCLDLLRPTLKTVPKLDLKNGTVGEAVDKIAALLKLEVKREETGLLLTVPAADNNFTVAEYDLTEFIQNSAKNESDGLKGATDPNYLPTKLTATDVSNLILLLIDPESWSTSGGKGELKMTGETKFSVRQTKNTQIKIRRLIEQIRSLRGMEPNKDLPVQEVIPEELGSEKLSELMTLNYTEAVPLVQVLSQIGQKYQLQIFLDEAAFRASGVELETKVSVRFTNQSIDFVLSSLLSSLQLSYIILADDTIFVTSRNTAESYMTVEVHLFALPDGKQLSAEELQTLPARLRAETAPDSWAKVDKDGKTSGSGGVIQVDPVSCCLLIRQSQPIQRQVQQWLSRMLKK